MLRTLYNNIVFAGGGSMFPGVKERFHKDMASLIPSGVELGISGRNKRQYSSWIGGAILSSIQNYWKKSLGFSRSSVSHPDDKKYRAEIFTQAYGDQYNFF